MKNRAFLKMSELYKRHFGNCYSSKNTSIDTAELREILDDPAKLRDFREFLLPMRVPDMEVDIDLFLNQPHLGIFFLWTFLGTRGQFWTSKK